MQSYIGQPKLNSGICVQSLDLGKGCHYLQGSFQSHTNKFPRKSNNFQVSSTFCIWLYLQIVLITCSQTWVWYCNPPSVDWRGKKNHMIKSTEKSICQNTTSIHNIKLTENTEEEEKPSRFFHPILKSPQKYQHSWHHICWWESRSIFPESEIMHWYPPHHFSSISCWNIWLKSWHKKMK